MLYPDRLRRHIADLLEWKNLTLTGVYNAEPYTMEMMEEWLAEYCEPIKPFIKDTSSFLMNASSEGKSILFEAQLGALRDLDFGIYPYTTSSNPIAAYAPVGAGVPSIRPDKVIGVVKAYSTCVGEGPFVGEMSGDEAERLREAGSEYGAKTGRPRRVGPLDLVATRYGVEMQAATDLAITKMDVLSYMDRIPVCVRYRIDGEETDRFPFPALLDKAEAVIEWVEGWQSDISGIRSWDELPPQAQKYIEMIENATGCRVTYISVGPERDSIIIRQENSNDRQI